MRLDLFLRSSRLVIRRTLAQSYCDAGAIVVNGAVAKSSRPVKIGDEISVPRSGGTLTVRVRALPATKQVSKDAAAGLYEILGQTPDDLGIG